MACLLLHFRSFVVAIHSVVSDFQLICPHLHPTPHYPLLFLAFSSHNLLCNEMQHTHFVLMSEEELLAERATYVARAEEFKARKGDGAEDDEAADRPRGWRARKCSCCMAPWDTWGGIATDMSRRSFYGIFG